ncbi:unnamed protein product [Rotaria socialis]|uniref:ELM2 domain-containing protein n=2 Tax=Rotaria socialis TaxID=392032 RepID=A0A818EYN4_9BILA|nr:unnamed protein product [Rotaria socialis]CAF3465734.1 unnamed protein product [Rotaria socialis]CAF3485990.1 unnamed protein product [Rotaria socialis]CAF4128714.1 unnamed protein product [Rotaria socialis]CAF4689926.1 unnamed protein product [Rotaria socialis]
MAALQNESEDLLKEPKIENNNEPEQIENIVKVEIINEEEEQQQQQISVTSELLQTEIVKLTVESEMPIEDLRKLYTSSSNIANMPTPKQEETSTSSEDSTDQEDGSGYQRLLIAEHPAMNENGEEEDMDDSSFSFYWQKAINIGDQYQAVVPDLLLYTDQNDEESPNDQLLWSPPTDTNQDENSTAALKYLKLASKEHRTADQENVLEVFLASNYNIDQALEKLREPTTNKNFFASAPWSLTECDQFEQCFKERGKDFSMFKIPSRTTNELIFFYYIWKKSARHDVFVRQNRVEKRRFHLHPYVTDYLEKFFVEQELQLISAFEQNNSSLSSSLNPQSSGHDQLVSKRRLSSDLFLKPMTTIKRPKSLIQPNDSDLIEINENQQTALSTSPISIKKLHDDDK